MSGCGKGDVRRPRLVDRKTFDSNWDSIFKKSTDKVNQEPTEDQDDDCGISAGSPKEFWAEDLED